MPDTQQLYNIDNMNKRFDLIEQHLNKKNLMSLKFYKIKTLKTSEYFWSLILIGTYIQCNLWTIFEEDQNNEN